jgi:hypothetical protein
MKKINWATIILLVAAITMWAMGCDAPDGPNQEDGAPDGNIRLVVSITKWGGYVDVVVMDGSTATFPEYTMDMNLSTQGVAPNSVPDTDLYIEYYTIDYISSDPAAVPLNSFNVPLGTWLGPSDTAKYTNVILVPWENTQLYFATGDLTQEVIYDCRLTFHGYTTYGYEYTGVHDIYAVFTDYAD